VCVLYSPENKKNNELKKKQKFSLCPKNEKKPDVLFYYLTGKSFGHFGRIVSTLPAGLKYLLTLSLLLGLSPFCV
jgi:hypothetical protein